MSYDDDGSSLVAALRDQQFLVITLGVMAPPDTHAKIVNAAGKAGVPYIMPNVYGGDVLDSKLIKEDLYSEASLARLDEVKALGGPSYIAMGCGFWYEWSLSTGEPWFGFDIANKKVTFMDDGKTMIDTSTWDQCGRALAALLSLPESGAKPAIADWKNKGFYLHSFKINQRDMLDSIHRVTGSSDKDWEITYEPSDARYQRGLKEMKEGNRLGFPTAMYARAFFPREDGNADGEFGSKRGLVNDTLGLPKESLDEATKRVVESVEGGWSYKSLFG